MERSDERRARIRVCLFVAATMIVLKGNRKETPRDVASFITFFFLGGGPLKMDTPIWSHCKKSHCSLVTIDYWAVLGPLAILPSPLSLGCE